MMSKKAEKAGMQLERRTTRGQGEADSGYGALG